MSICLPLLQERMRFSAEAQQGVIDARAWNPAKQGPIRLDGQWEFVWHRIATPLEFASRQLNHIGYLQVPGSWTFQKVDGQPLEVTGYGTYRLTVLLPDIQRTMGIRVGNIRNAHELFLNGIQYRGSGIVADNPEQTVQFDVSQANYFPIDNDNKLEIVIPVASFESFSSGIHQSIFLGLEEDIRQITMRNTLYDSSLAAIFLVFGLYFLVFYFQHKKNLEMLYFSLSCFVLMINIVFTSERIFAQLFPHSTYLLNLTITYLSGVISAWLFARYIYYGLKGQIPKFILRTIDITTGILIILPLIVRQQFPFGYVSPVLVMLIYAVLFVYIYHAIQRKVEGSWYVAMFFISALQMVVLSVVTIFWHIDNHFFVPIAPVLVILSQAFHMSYNISTSYETIELKRDSLTALDQLKDEFLAKTSHELKTPLNGIINISQSVLQGVSGPVNEKQAYELQLVRDLGKRLSYLVNDILDISKAKHAQLKLNIQPIDLHSVVTAVFDVFSYQLLNRSVQLVNHIEQGKFILLADENRLHQIIFNLIENALKYTTSGRIEIYANQQDGMAWIEVKDTGIGIPNEKLKDIFHEYVQLEEPVVQMSNSLGLGLPIIRTLVELHGGLITISSKVNQGTVVTFSMPMVDEDHVQATAAYLRTSINPISQSNPLVQQAEQQDIAPPTEPDQSLNWDGQLRDTQYSLNVLHLLEQTTVLIVDDDYFNQVALTNTLKLANYHVHAVSNGETALEVLAQGIKYDIIVLDIMMPGISGYEVCRQLRMKYSLLELPILLLSANASAVDIEVGFKAGANDYVAKPFEASELLARVKTLTQLKKANEELIDMQISLLQAQIKPQFINDIMHTISERCYHEPKRAAQLLTSFSQFFQRLIVSKPLNTYFPFHEEMALVESYLDLEKARLGDKLTIELAIDAQAYTCRIPPLMIQPLVENAIHHGILDKVPQGKIGLFVHKVDNQLLVTVEDNGIGMPDYVVSGLNRTHSASQPIGLSNIQHRLMYLTGKGIDVQSIHKSGTRISFVIPQYR